MMTKSEFVAEVEDGFPRNECCSECLLAGGAKLLDVESDLVPEIASGFCVGMSYQKLACGAVTGAVMVLGLVERAGGPSVENSVPGLIRGFRDRFGSANCYELTNLDLRDPDQMKKLDVAKCTDYVRFAAEYLYDVIDIQRLSTE